MMVIDRVSHAGVERRGQKLLTIERGLHLATEVWAPPMMSASSNLRVQSCGERSQGALFAGE